jgi:hypothetical protein
MAGTTSRLACSTHPDSTFDSVSSSAVRTIDGTSAACAGRVTVMPMFTRGASTKTTHLGEPVAMAAATPPMVTPCTTYPTTRTRPGRRRSAHAPSRGPSAMHGASWTTAISDADDAPPCR